MKCRTTPRLRANFVRGKAIIRRTISTTKSDAKEGEAARCRHRAQPGSGQCPFVRAARTASTRNPKETITDIPAAIRGRRRSSVTKSVSRNGPDVFRQFCPKDAQLLFELDSDPEVMRFITKGVTLQSWANSKRIHSQFPRLLRPIAAPRILGCTSARHRRVHRLVSFAAG
jgi:hypothetical protein